MAERKPDGEITERGRRLRLSQGRDKDESRTEIQARLTFPKKQWT